MEEFVNRQFETRQSYEIDEYIERAAKLVPAPGEAEGQNYFTWTTFNTDPNERLLLQVGMGTSEKTHGSWIFAGERPANPQGDYINVTKYIIHIDQRIFLVKNERVPVTDKSLSSKDSNDVIKMELSLGMYAPTPTDWERMGWIIDKGQEFLLMKKGFEIAQMGKTIQNLINNTEELS